MTMELHMAPEKEDTAAHLIKILMFTTVMVRMDKAIREYLDRTAEHFKPSPQP